MKQNDHLEKQIPLYLYSELGKAEKEEFEAHLDHCGRCREQLEATRTLHNTLGEKASLEPSKSLMSKLRSGLRERLRDERKAEFNESWWDRFIEKISERGAGIQLAGALAFLIVGILIGRAAFLPANTETQFKGEFAAGLQEENSLPFMASVDLIQYDPKSGNITVQYKSIKDVSLHGNVGDPAIRKLLVHAIRTEEHPGRRLTAVRASGAKSFSDEELEDALIYAMQNDEIDGVRLKAANVLTNLPMNEKIKRAFIRTLLKDTNSAIRIEALNALSGIEDEADVRPIFRGASQDDDNEFVRLQASKALERLQNPNIKNTENR